MKQKTEKRYREFEDYKKINEGSHSNIISIIESRFQTSENGNTKTQKDISKMQLCHK